MMPPPAKKRFTQKTLHFAMPGSQTSGPVQGAKDSSDASKTLVPAAPEPRPAEEGLPAKMIHFFPARPIKTEADSTASMPSAAAPSTSSSTAHEDVQRKGRGGRKYQPSWKEKFPWIAYDSTKEKVFCAFCTQAVKMDAQLPSFHPRDQETLRAFVHDGFSSWNKALERYRKHENSSVHRAAFLVFVDVMPEPTEADSTASTPSAAAPSTSSSTAQEDVQRKGRQGRKYQPSWKEKFPWIAYDSTKEKVFCAFCTQAELAQLPSVQARDQETLRAFVHDGFSSWSKAIERYRKHEKGSAHRAAILAFADVNATENVVAAFQAVANVNASVNVVASMSAGTQQQMADSRALLVILSSLQYLSHRGLAIRGKTDDESNLTWLLKLRGKDVPELRTWLDCKGSEWLSPEIIDEMLALLNCHKHVAQEKVDLDVIANMFINRTSARSSTFLIKK